MNETERWTGGAGPGGGAAGEVRRQADATVRGLAAEAKAVAGSAGEAITAKAESGKDEVAERMSTVAERLKGSADELRGDEAWLADMVDQGALHLGRLAEGLKSRDLRGVLDQVEEFGRRQPAIFAGAAVAVGFALTRFARASGDTHHTEAGDSSGSSYRPTAPGSTVTP